MPRNAAIIATFDRYPDADAAVKTLTGAGFTLKNIGIIGAGYHSEFVPAAWSKASGRIKSWSMRGALSGAVTALVLGAVFTPTSVSGSVFLLGYIAAVIVCVIEGAAVMGVVGLAGAIARDTLDHKTGAIHYDHVTKADSFQVIARGTVEQTDRGKAIVAAMHSNGEK